MGLNNFHVSAIEFQPPWSSSPGLAWT